MGTAPYGWWWCKVGMKGLNGMDLIFRIVLAKASHILYGVPGIMWEAIEFPQMF